MLTDSEIIKAVELCRDGNCQDCSYRLGMSAECIPSILHDVLGLINRYKAEIETFADIGKMYSEVKADAIKEFAGSLCRDRASNDPVVIAVKAELKLMEGEIDH